jgi:hypothetical protein
LTQDQNSESNSLTAGVGDSGYTSPRIDEVSEEDSIYQMPARLVKTEITQFAEPSKNNTAANNGKKIPRLLLGSSIVSRSQYALTERTPNSENSSKFKLNKNLYKNSSLFKKSSFRLMPMKKVKSSKSKKTGSGL